MSYCTVDDVTDYMLIDLADGNTDLTATQIQNIINLKMDWLDAKLGHAYRSAQIKEEYHDIDHDGYRYGLGARIPLYHRMIHTIDEAAGDKIEYRNTDTWVTLASDQYSIDTTPGILYINKLYYLWNTNNIVRVSYHYGDTTVPGWLRHTCIQLVTIHLLQTIWRQLPIDHNQIDTIRDTIQQWQESVDETIVSHQESVIV